MNISISENYSLIFLVSMIAFYFLGRRIWDKTNHAVIRKYGIKALTLTNSFRFFIIASSPFLFWYFMRSLFYPHKMTPTMDNIQFLSLFSCIFLATYLARLMKKTDLRIALRVSILLCLTWPIAIIHALMNVLIVFSNLPRGHANSAGIRASRSTDRWEKISQYHTHKNDYDAGRRGDPPPPII